MQLPPTPKPQPPKRPSREQVLTIVQQQGPILPSQIMRQVGGDTILIGAMLSELSANKLVKISNTKIGSSPTYYVSGQEEKLEGLLQHLNGKDRETVAILKEQKVLRDDAQTPLLRVSLRNVKDFARKIEANLEGGPVIFWRYYLVPEQEAVAIIKRILDLDKPREVPKQVHAEAVKPVIEQKQAREEIPALAPIEFDELKDKPKKPVSVKQKKPPVQKEIVQTSLSSTIELEDSEFSETIQKYFGKNTIKVLSAKTLTKKTQYEYNIEIPSQVGTLAYYCIARDKKSINEGDISNAYVLGQKKGLPILYLTTGSLTKKAQALLNTEFKSMTVKQV